jgi:polysaccharide biosynthesis protein PslH
MKILLIKNRLPYPLRSGQDLVDYSLIKALSQKHEITLISPCESNEHMQEALPELKKFCSEVKAVPMPDIRSLGPKLRWRLKREYNFWLKFIPLPASDYSYESLHQTVTETVCHQKFDFAEVAFWMLGQYLKEVKPKCPILLLEHDSEYLNALRQSRFGRASKITVQIRDWYTRMTPILDYERRICQPFDWVLFLSSVDMEGVKDKFGICDRSSVIPVPYYIQPDAIAGTKAPSANILFLGGMHTPYNIESIRHFRDLILPIIRAEIPDIMLTIVGNPPSRRIAAQLDSLHIRYSGFQKDLTETFKAYQVLIAPVWTGTGIKTKIIEGIARGMPIVSTPIGIEGIDLTPERDFLLGRSDQEFAQKVIRLLKEPDLRQVIAKNAIERFKSSFCFDQVSSKTLAMYEFALASIRAKK